MQSGVDSGDVNLVCIYAPMTAAERNSALGSRIVRVSVMLAAATILVLLLAAIAASRVPMRGAELFGALANKIKGNPGATAYISLAAGAGLWIGLAVFVAAQEWLAARRRTP
jgi:hypothetical protein